MKRCLLIGCLLALSHVMFGYDLIQHVFPNHIATYEASYTIAHMTDGTVYTCTDKASFTSYNETIALKLQNNGVVVISPAISRLREIWIFHNNGTISLNVYTSVNGSDWTKQAVTPSYQLVKVLGLEGDYQVKIENKTGSDVYLTEVKYYTEPCHCLRVVSE